MKQFVKAVGGKNHSVIYTDIKNGKYSGDLVANQHRYRFKGDTPLGSYDWDWLFTSKGKQIKLYKKEFKYTHRQ